MTKLFQNYKRESIEFIKAADNYLVDKEGNFYLDFSSGIGVTNLGFHKQSQASSLGAIGSHLA